MISILTALVMFAGIGALAADSAAPVSTNYQQKECKIWMPVKQDPKSMDKNCWTPQKQDQKSMDKNIWTPVKQNPKSMEKLVPFNM
jgi:hypothetical protein